MPLLGANQPLSGRSPHRPVSFLSSTSSVRLSARRPPTRAQTGASYCAASTAGSWPAAGPRKNLGEASVFPPVFTADCSTAHLGNIAINPAAGFQISDCDGDEHLRYPPSPVSRLAWTPAFTRRMDFADRCRWEQTQRPTSRRVATPSGVPTAAGAYWRWRLRPAGLLGPRVPGPAE